MSIEDNHGHSAQRAGARKGRKPNTRKGETKQHNTDPKRVTKKQKRKEMNAELSLYQCDHKYWPITQERLEIYGYDLLLMLDENPNMLNLRPFFKKHKLTRSQVDHYLHKEENEKFRAMWVEAKQQIGERILERGLNKQADAGLTKWILPMYSDAFKELEEWRSHLKTLVAEAQKPTITVVEMPTIQSSGLVPDKIIKEEEDGR